MLEELLGIVFKVPKTLHIAGVILLIGSIVFHFEFFPIFTKVANFLYINKVTTVMSKVLESIIPGM